MRVRFGLLGLIAALAVALLAPPVGAQQSSGGWGLAQLMQRLHQVKSASAQFTERKTLHVLTEPLISSGTLLYVAPDQVQKITVLPKRERFAIDGDTLTMDGTTEGQSRRLSLAEHPEIGALVEGIRATLAGDLPALDRFYTVQFGGSPQDWHLFLQPKEARLQKFLKSIRIAGSGNRITSVDTEEADGDRSEMSIVEDAR